MMEYLLLALLFLILFTAFWGARSAAPYVPTWKNDVARMMDLAEVKGGEKIYDLGCGDGRIVFAAAKRGADAVGIEIFLLPYLYAYLKSLWRERTRIMFGDMFNLDISKADTVFIFLMSKSYARMTEKFEKELKPGAKVIASCWPIKGWEDKLAKIDRPSNKVLPLFLYIR